MINQVTSNSKPTKQTENKKTKITQKDHNLVFQKNR